MPIRWIFADAVGRTLTLAKLHWIWSGLMMSFNPSLTTLDLVGADDEL